MVSPCPLEAQQDVRSPGLVTRLHSMKDLSTGLDLYDFREERKFHGGWELPAAFFAAAVPFASDARIPLPRFANLKSKDGKRPTPHHIEIGNSSA